MINLEELKEKWRKRKEKKEFVRTELKKGEVIGKFKFTTPEDISKFKKPKERKAISKKVGSRVRELAQKTFQKPKVSKTQLDLARERTKQMQLQRRFEVEQLAQQQRAFYEQDDMSMQPQQMPMEPVSTEQFAREQMIEEQRNIQSGPRQRGGFGEAWRKFRAGQPTRDRTRQVGMFGVNRQQVPGQPGMIQSNPVNNLLTPVGSPLVRSPANLAAPINNNIPWRIKTW